MVPIIIEGLQDPNPGKSGIRAIWIAPIRALTNEIRITCQRALEGLGLNWRVEIRSGDTSTAQRKKQLEDPPEIMITTPESIHLMMATKGYEKLFRQMKAIVADEWHELMGSKRGVQVQLGISRIRGLSPKLKVWGISATIQNIDEALEVLIGPNKSNMPHIIIKSGLTKKIAVESIIPDEIERYPWAGHLGIQLLEKVVPIIQKLSLIHISEPTRPY